MGHADVRSTLTRSSRPSAQRYNLLPREIWVMVSPKVAVCCRLLVALVAASLQVQPLQGETHNRALVATATETMRQHRANESGANCCALCVLYAVAEEAEPLSSMPLQPSGCKHPSGRQDAQCSRHSVPQQPLLRPHTCMIFPGRKSNLSRTASWIASSGSLPVL